MFRVTGAYAYYNYVVRLLAIEWALGLFTFKFKTINVLIVLDMECIDLIPPVYFGML
jgi:endo-1,4-beta-D-glucanase Y